MSSRTPAPDDFRSMAMPDLPTDLFEGDGALYDPVEQHSYMQSREVHDAWDEDAPADTYPGYSDDLDGYVDDRPRRRPRRHVDDVNVDPDGSRRSHRQSDDFDEDIDRPRRKPRRQQVDDPLDAPRERRRTRRGSRDDEYFASTRSLDDDVDPPAYEAPSPATKRRPQPSQRPARRSLRQDTVIEQPRMRAEAVTADIVTNVRPSANAAPARPRVRKPKNPAWQWKSIVMPQPRQMAEQAFPSLLMAASLLGTLGVIGFIPGGLPLWAPMILIPTILLLFRARQDVHPMWGRSAIINLVVVGAFFPMMIVRQSFLRVPFVEFGNGTLVMPILSTLVVVLAMVVIALASAFLSQDDPEYAGMLFLPAALLVPFFAGATEITGLETALAIIGTIYVACAVLTVVASMLPNAFPTLVAPIALALEFFVLPVSESTPIFPVGAGMSAKLLFFVVLAMGVGLTIAVPMLAVWVRQVRRIVGDSLHRNYHVPAAV